MFKGVYPISGEDLLALPVNEINAAVGFYPSVLGLTTVSSDGNTALLQRDAGA